MKRFFLPIAILAAAVGLSVSCQKEISDRNEGLKELHFIVKGYQDAVTRTTLTDNGDGTYTPGWSKGDELGAFLGTTTITTGVNLDMTLTNTANAGATAVFEGSAVAAGSGTFQAFYPKSAFEKSYSGGGIGLNIGDKSDNYKQYPSVGAPDPACNILVSKACDYESDGDNVVIDNLYFTRPLSVLKIKLNGTFAANEEVSSFKLSVSSGTLSGRVDINLQDASINSWTAAKSYVWAEYTDSKPVVNHETNNTVYFVVNPTTIASGTEVTVEAETENYTISKSFTLKANMTFPVNEIAVLNLSIAEDNCTPKEVFIPKTYNKITEASQLGEGEYIICMKLNDEDPIYYLENTVKTKPGGKSFGEGIALSSDGKSITISSEDITNATWTFASAEGGFSLTPTSNDKAGLGTTNANDGLTCQTTYFGKAWTIEENNDYNWTFKFNETSRYLVVYGESSRN